jgi:hypothetical protein
MLSLPSDQQALAEAEMSSFLPDCLATQDWTVEASGLSLEQVDVLVVCCFERPLRPQLVIAEMFRSQLVLRVQA